MLEKLLKRLEELEEKVEDLERELESHKSGYYKYAHKTEDSY